MEVFKYSKSYYYKVLASIILALTLIIVIRTVLSVIVLIGCIAVMISGVIGKRQVEYILDGETIDKKGFKARETLIVLSEVERITKITDKKETFAIQSSNGVFVVSPVIGDYKRMLDLIVKTCESNDNITIQL